MFPCRVPMVVRAWFCPPRSYDLFVDLYNVVRHAADGVVELMGLIHHGHMTCGWSSMGVSAVVRGPVRGLVRHAADGIVDLNGLIHHGHMTCVWSVGPCQPRRRRDRGTDGTDSPGSYDLWVVAHGRVRHGRRTCTWTRTPHRRLDRGLIVLTIICRVESQWSI